MKRRVLVKTARIVLLFSLLAVIMFGCDAVSQEQRDCVVMLGDSIFANSNIYDYLQEQSGQQYRTYYQSSAAMTGARNIENQYERAISAGDIRTIIMNGGGADNLIGTSSLQADERMIEEVNRAWIKILTSAKSDGVQNFVVLGYYKSDLLRDNARMDDWRNEIIVLLQETADALGLNLVYVDPRNEPWFAAREPSEYLMAGGIIPNDRASRQLANLIWQAMVDNNIEQGAGCPQQ